MQQHNRLSIIFVTNNYTPYSGGVVSSINASVDELRKAGHKVWIITLDFLGKKHNDPAYVIRVPCPIKFTYKTNPMAVPWRPYSFLLKKIQELQPDVIHVHHPFLLGRLALRIAKKLMIPTVFTYHTMYEAYAHYLFIPVFITRFVTKQMVLSFCRRVDGIVAPSGAIKQYLIHEKIKTLISIIPSGLQSYFLPATKPKEQPCENRPFRLLAVGRFVKEKNIPFLLNVFQQLQGDFILTLVGYGSEYEAIKKYAYQELKLSSQNVYFVHKPSKKKLVRYYQHADLFLFSSTTDTQGLVLSEAMASGTPVIAVDGPGQRDVIQNGKNGFLVDTVEGMVHKIEAIAENTQVLALLQEGAFQTAHKYMPAELTGELVGFYRQAKKQHSIDKV